jgi:hypothetical protein
LIKNGGADEDSFSCINPSNYYIYFSGLCGKPLRRLGKKQILLGKVLAKKGGLL